MNAVRLALLIQHFALEAYDEMNVVEPGRKDFELALARRLARAEREGDLLALEEDTA